MSRSLDDLTSEFRGKVEQLLGVCHAAGVEMRPYFTVRTPFEQGKLWRQSRSSEEVQGKIDELRAKGADFLAQCIESVGPQHGEHVTNAMPGFSWHQWGEAVDCFWLVNGKAEWSTTRKVDGINGYRVYAEKAQGLGLEAGGFWRRLKDWPHVQLRADANPSRVFTLEQIDAEMRSKFGGG